MNCSQCGTEVPAGSAFCSQCGAQLTGGAAARQPAAAKMQPGAAAGNSKDVPEEDLWSGAYSPKAMTGPFVGATLFAVAAVVVGSLVPPFGWAVGLGLAVLLFAYLGWLLFYKRMSVKYRLTTHRLVLQRGILSRTDDRILLVDVDDITVHQGVLERMLNIGRIILNTTDETTKQRGKGVLVMEGIENARQVGDTIDEARRTERSRRGLYMMNA